MHIRPHPRRLLAMSAAGLLFSLGASQCMAAAPAQPAPQPASAAPVEKAQKPMHKVIRTRVEPPRVPTRPQRPVKQLRPK